MPELIDIDEDEDDEEEDDEAELGELYHCQNILVSIG